MPPIELKALENGLGGRDRLDYLPIASKADRDRSDRLLRGHRKFALLKVTRKARLSVGMNASQSRNPVDRASKFHYARTNERENGPVSGGAVRAAWSCGAHHECRSSGLSQRCVVRRPRRL